MKYEIKINEFEGPLDLLLHLIKQSNINIQDISIDEITKQYLEYIEEMEQLNLDIASEYLVMAAELIEIKAKSLLPKSEDDSEDELESSKENLINRLLEYEKYKNLTESFKELEDERSQIYTRVPDSLNQFKSDEDIDYGIDLNDLVNAMTNFLQNKELAKPLNTKITNKEYSIVRRSKEIKNILKVKKKVKFTELFDVFNKEYIVITFLSILTMSKNKEIELEQENNFKEIIVKGKGV